MNEKIEKQVKNIKHVKVLRKQFKKDKDSLIQCSKLNYFVYPYVLNVELLESLAIPHVMKHMTKTLQHGLN